MHRVAILQLKVHHVMMYGMKDQVVRSEYRESRRQAEKQYELAYSTVIRMFESIKEMENTHGMSIDLNKVTHLARMHDQMLEKMCISYDLKNKNLNKNYQIRKQRQLTFKKIVQKKKYLETKKKQETRTSAGMG